MNSPSLAKELAMRLVDENPPRVVKDEDPGVRMKLCEALGNMSDKARTLPVVERLLKCMADEEEKKDVRNRAYAALISVTGESPQEGDALNFNGNDPSAQRKAAVDAWMNWLDLNKDSLPEEL